MKDDLQPRLAAATEDVDLWRVGSNQMKLIGKGREDTKKLLMAAASIEGGVSPNIFLSDCEKC